MRETWEFLGIVSLRLVTALICGAVVGLERKKRRKKAGIRTHCLVALGAAIFAIISKYGFSDVISPGNDADIARVAANVVSGVSFLGAGVIFLRNKSVSGLTTAAGIWSVAGVGLAVGCGLYSVGAVGTLCMLFCQYVIYKPLRKIEGYTPRPVQARIVKGDENIDNFIGVLKNIDKDFLIQSLTKHPDGSIDIVFSIKGNGEFAFDIYDFMKKYPYITQMNI
ncbi:MAG: MgtC/SapB family protein [Lachnospiraceae bacterium]|nr:MgtC/SapB family protein [Lachnospiraceae bacterium]